MAILRQVPGLLRAWPLLRPFRPSARAAPRLARLLTRPDRVYRTSAGFRFRIDPSDPFQVAMLLDRYDPVLDAVVRRYARAGTEAVDAGAHLGYVTLRLARAVGPSGRVHAFECDPRVAERLREHLTLNELGNVSVNEVALLDGGSDRTELKLTRHLGWATVELPVWDTVAEVITVPAVSFDEHAAAEGIDPERLSVVKVDVEGAELAALRGMRETLAASRAAVLVEYVWWRMLGLGERPADLLELMADCGYEPWSPRLRGRGRLELTAGAHPEGGDDVLFLKR